MLAAFLRSDERNAPVTLSRRLVAVAGALGALGTCWGLALTGYLCFQDEIAAVLLRRQAEMQGAYEAQITGLKRQLERSASQALVERQQVDARIATLLARQAQIDSRQGTLTALAERTIGPVGSGTPPSPASTGPAPDKPDARQVVPSRASKPTPLDEMTNLPGRDMGDRARSSAGDKLSRLEDALDRASAEQFRVLALLQKTARSRLDVLDRTIVALGIDTQRAEAPGASKSGVGGPLVPLPWNAATSPFDLTTGELETTIQRFTRLRQVARSLPLTRPMAGTLDPSSPFGARVDPFTRSAALHTGIDLRAEHGTEVRAAGPGRITSAESSGGYGNMVEIDHGNDVVTRYAHLSVINVSEGQEVVAGAIIGHVGSTGRSTGAHLHYETRIAGEPVNPQRFLDAGARLAAGPVTRHAGAARPGTY